MNSAIPKQYLILKNKTILEHAITPFLAHPRIEKVIIAVSKEDHYYSTIALLHSDKIQCVFGGETRAHSVFNALQQVENEAWVLVHDAARPCLTTSDLNKLLAVEEEQGAILATPAIDTMKRAKGNSIQHTEDRSTLWHALTPQFFNAGLLKQAIQSALIQQQTITDEASAMELMGYHPQLIVGRSDNIKVTRPEDLALAEFYLTFGERK